MTVIGTEGRQIQRATEAQTESNKMVDTVCDYSDIEVEETHYLYFPWFIRGKLVAVQGDTSTGKSTFLYGIGAYVSLGKDIFGIPCEAPGNVMYITLEDSPGEIKTAFMDSGGDLTRLKRIKRSEIISKLTLGKDECIKYLETVIKAYNLTFLVLDPIQAFLAGDINHANDTRPQMAGLADIAEKTGCCITFIQHTGKDVNRKGIHKGLGTVDIVAASRSLLQVVVDPENEDYNICYTVKNNTASKYDTEQAIRYRLRDHPDSFDYQRGKHRHFHGHAEFCGLIPRYNERIYKAKLNRSELMRTVMNNHDFDAEPLVKTITELIRQNPEGMFIRMSDLIRCITDHCGKCPYPQGKSSDSLKKTADRLRTQLIEAKKIQIDWSDNPLKPKAFIWAGKAFSFDNDKPERGYHIRNLTE